MEDVTHSSGESGWGIGEAKGHYSGDEKSPGCFEGCF